MRTPTYRIKNWSEFFETSESRKRRVLPWIAIPTKHDGKSYRRLMREFGPAIYGAWVLICAIAAKCPIRGTLADTDGPLSAIDISDKTDCPVAVIEQALAAFVSERIGWMEIVDLLDVRQIIGQYAGTPVLPDQTRPDQTLQNQTKPTGQVFENGSVGGNARKQRVFGKLGVEHLPDSESLESWFEWHSVQPFRFVEHDDRGKLLVFGAAERDMEVGENPPSLFKHILKNKAWHLITQAQEDRAAARIKKLRTNGNGVTK